MTFGRVKLLPVLASVFNTVILLLNTDCAGYNFKYFRQGLGEAPGSTFQAIWFEYFMF